MIGVAHSDIEVLAGSCPIILQHRAITLRDRIVEVALGLLIGRPLERGRNILDRRLIMVGEAFVALDGARLLLQADLLGQLHSVN